MGAIEILLKNSAAKALRRLQQQFFISKRRLPPCDWQFQREHCAENYNPVAGRETELITLVQGWPKVISERTGATPPLCGVNGRTGRSVLNHVVGSTSRATRAREWQNAHTVVVFSSCQVYLLTLHCVSIPSITLCHWLCFLSRVEYEFISISYITQLIRRSSLWAYIVCSANTSCLQWNLIASLFWNKYLRFYLS